MPFWQTSPSLHHREHLTAAAPAPWTLLCFQGSGSALKRCPNPPPAAALQHPRGDSSGPAAGGAPCGAPRGARGAVLVLGWRMESVLVGNELHSISCVCFAFGNSLLTCFLCCSDSLSFPIVLRVVFFSGFGVFLVFVVVVVVVFWKVDKWLGNVQFV